MAEKHGCQLWCLKASKRRSREPLHINRVRTVMPVLVVDNMSPFTTNILDCLQGLNIKYTYRKFSEVFDNDLEACDKVMLSGRRKNSRQINAANSAIIKQCLQRGKPLLGICYGAEIIALTLGGSISKMPFRVQGPIQISLSKPNSLTDNKKSIS